MLALFQLLPCPARRPDRDARVLFTCLLFLLLPAVSATAQSLGILEGNGDIGHVLLPGSSGYNSATMTYTLTGSGSNLWFTADEMQFAWKRMHGDVSLTAAIDFVGDKGNNHRKAALMIRQSLDPASPYADVARHGDGLTSLQFRLARGEVTREIETPVTAPQWVRLVKRGDLVTVHVGDSPDAMHFSGASIHVHLSGDFYVGLAICSHDKDVTETAQFRHLAIDPLPPGDAAGPLWSTLETVKIASSDRRVAYTVPNRLSAPVWSPDGTAITFIQGTTPERFVLDPAPYPSLGVQAALAKQPAPTDLSAAEPAPSAQKSDWVYTSSGPTGAAQLWRMHPDGSAKERLLAEASDDLAPQPSPDGKSLVYLAFPSGHQAGSDPEAAELRLLSLANRQPELLGTLFAIPTDAHALSWSPDSTRVAFISHAQPQ